MSLVDTISFARFHRIANWPDDSTMTPASCLSFLSKRRHYFREHHTPIASHGSAGNLSIMRATSNLRQWRFCARLYTYKANGSLMPAAAAVNVMFASLCQTSVSARRRIVTYALFLRSKVSFRGEVEDTPACAKAYFKSRRPNHTGAAKRPLR